MGIRTSTDELQDIKEQISHLADTIAAIRDGSARAEHQRAAAQPQQLRQRISCQRSKIQRHTLTALGALPTPDSRFHLDIVGPLPPCHGQTYLLTCVDRFTSSAEAIPIVDNTAETVASAFLYHLVARFGVLSTITTDHGRQFESAPFTSITQVISATRIRTTAYHPMSNGMVERFHCQLEAALTATEEHSWVEALSLGLLGIRSTLKADIGCSAAELDYGTTLRLPGEYLCTAQTRRLLLPVVAHFVYAM
ncbi:uncharacterized protein LOC119463624 [Dermacentor silvarum]|uniref:uncharacterized protein LOC119463624 n=1 Tax=Dermacentor silvarum TaxID=543639 RepID=UPI00189B1218|nr:uncharacterized protein LOC119463624 [Dermacentor silvarum]